MKTGNKKPFHVPIPPERRCCFFPFVLATLKKICLVILAPFMNLDSFGQLHK